MGTPATRLTKLTASIGAGDAAQRSAHYRLAVALIIAASCVRIFVCFSHDPMDYLSSDMMRHWQNGLHFPKGGYTGAADPIGYQLYICVLQRITFGNRGLIALASALMSVLMPWTYYRAARDFGLTRISALWAWVLIAWAPSLLTIYHYIMPETLLLFLEGVGLWMTARYLRKAGRRAFFLSIFFWTLAALTKPTVIPLAAICVLWSWWKKPTPVRDIAVGILLAGAMLIPQAIRSRVVLGFMAPFGNSWLTRIQLRSGVTTIHFRVYAYPPDFMGFHAAPTYYDLGFTSPSSSIHPLRPLSEWAPRRALKMSAVDLTINSRLGERSWEGVYNQFNQDSEERYAQWRENIILFFFSPSWPEAQWDGQINYLSRWLWAPLIFLVLAGNIRAFLLRRFHLIPVAVTLFTLIMGLQNMLIMEGRYRKPVESVLLLNFAWLLDSKSTRSGRSEGAPLLAAGEPTPG